MAPRLRSPLRAAALVVAAVVLAACQQSAQEGPLPPEPYQDVPALPVPAVTAPSDAGTQPSAVPSISVSADPVETPDGGAGAGGDAATAEQSVIVATEAYEGRVFALVNDERVAAGLPELQPSGCATKVARDRAGRALPKPGLEHEPLDFSCAHGWAGENLAQHYGPPAAMVAAWMASQGHRENILRAEFTRTGVGCVAYDRQNPDRPATHADSIGGYLCSQVFLG